MNSAASMSVMKSLDWLKSRLNWNASAVTRRHGRDVLRMGPAFKSVVESGVALLAMDNPPKRILVIQLKRAGRRDRHDADFAGPAPGVAGDKNRFSCG